MRGGVAARPRPRRILRHPLRLRAHRLGQDLLHLGHPRQHRAQRQRRGHRRPRHPQRGAPLREDPGAAARRSPVQGPRELRGDPQRERGRPHPAVIHPRDAAAGPLRHGQGLLLRRRPQLRQVPLGGGAAPPLHARPPQPKRGGARAQPRLVAKPHALHRLRRLHDPGRRQRPHPHPPREGVVCGPGRERAAQGLQVGGGHAARDGPDQQVALHPGQGHLVAVRPRQDQGAVPRQQAHAAAHGQHRRPQPHPHARVRVAGVGADP
mmetsp:Transcript_10556/g.29850  ORF Transcript_10556/g.29850 Transcript_10556/m.29850 type:complete len:265 (-) Transcript_10556:251-1045(-)